MHSQLLTLKAKQLGIRITDRRQRIGISIEELCERSGITIEDLQCIEHGESNPSLPQLESIAFYLGVNFDELTKGKKIEITANSYDVNKLLQLQSLQNRMIGVQLKLARENGKLSLEDIADQCGISTGTFENYELGLLPIPFPELESMCAALAIPVENFLSKNDLFSGTQSETASSPGPLPDAKIPAELLEFVSNSANLPYIELAKKLSGMDAGKLRSIAEGLLEITY
jgi:transcriptional regulator with XRE-family HTH domain